MYFFTFKKVTVTVIATARAILFASNETDWNLFLVVMVAEEVVVTIV